MIVEMLLRASSRWVLPVMSVVLSTTGDEQGATYLLAICCWVLLMEAAWKREEADRG